MSILTAFDKFIQQALKYGFSLWGTAKTGVTTSYRTGDDGHFEKGYPRSGVRFVDNGDGTITDNATGLMWIKDPSQLGGDWGSPGTPDTMFWEPAIDDSLALNYAGHDDWRLPNIKELMSIADYSKEDPLINETFFPNTANNRYWSSTTFIGYTDAAWTIDFSSGGVANALKSADYPARPVRLGVPKV